MEKRKSSICPDRLRTSIRGVSQGFQTTKLVSRIALSHTVGTWQARPMPRLAMAYMGYQFGVLNKGLGDGRAFVWGQWRCSRHLNPVVPSSSCSLPSSASSNGLASNLDTLRSGGGGEDLTSINPSAGQYSSGEADEEEEEADEEEAEEAEAGELWEMGTKGSGKTPFSRGHDGLLTREGAVREVRKTHLYINTIIYQDRLGTNIGKSLKTRRVLCFAGDRIGGEKTRTQN
jgi:hypothetical protein